MTAHDHTELVPGCYRCDLGRDEVLNAITEERDKAIALLRLWVQRDCAHTFPVESCVMCGDRAAAAAFLGDDDR